MSVRHAMRRCRRPPRRRVSCHPLAVLAVLVATPALGQVTLDTAVSKVETLLEPSGRVKRELVPVEEVVPGDELRYTITFTNEGGTPVEAERIVITNPIPDGTVYLAGSAGGDGSRVEFSVDGETWSQSEPASAADAATGLPTGSAGPDADGVGAVDPPFPGEPAGAGGDERASPARSLRWTYQRALQPGESEQVYFHVRMR